MDIYIDTNEHECLVRSGVEIQTERGTYKTVHNWFNLFRVLDDEYRCATFKIFPFLW